jgi:hypothetical protein
MRCCSCIRCCRRLSCAALAREGEQLGEPSSPIRMAAGLTVRDLAGRIGVKSLLLLLPWLSQRLNGEGESSIECEVARREVGAGAGAEGWERWAVEGVSG